MRLIENDSKELFFHFEYFDQVGELDSVAQGLTLTLALTPSLTLTLTLTLSLALTLNPSTN